MANLKNALSNFSAQHIARVIEHFKDFPLTNSQIWLDGLKNLF